MIFDSDLPLDVLEKMPSYFDPPKNCPLNVHQSIMRQIYHCKRVIKKADFSINFK